MICLACHSKNYGPDTPENTLSFIHKLGFEHVTVETGVLSHETAASNPKQASEYMKILLEKNSLQPVEYVYGGISDGSNAFHPSQLPQAAMDAVCRDFDAVCKFARLSGFSSVMGTAGDAVRGMDAAQQFDSMAQTLTRLVKIAAENGVVYNLECGQRSILNSPQKSLDMALAVPGLSFTLDILHYQVHGYSTPDALRLLPYTRHMHARQAATGWNKCPIEYGEIDFDLVMKRLRGMYWDGAITMEFWITPAEARGNMSAVDQTIVMRYQLKQLIRKYWADAVMG